MESPLRDLAPAGLKVIETMRWDGSGFLRLDRHLARLALTCRELGFRFDARAVDRALGLAGSNPERVRLTLGSTGVPEVTTAALPPNPEFWRVAVSDHPLDPDDPWLRVKTTNRAHYDRAQADLPSGIDEMIFLNLRGEVCEGTITSIFADPGAGLLTPPLHCGLLPGVLREEMLANGDCRETVLTLPDLRNARRLFVGNSLRGLIPARLG